MILKTLVSSIVKNMNQVMNLKIEEKLNNTSLDTFLIQEMGLSAAEMTNQTLISSKFDALISSAISEMNRPAPYSMSIYFTYPLVDMAGNVIAPGSKPGLTSVEIRPVIANSSFSVSNWEVEFNQDSNVITAMADGDGDIKLQLLIHFADGAAFIHDILTVHISSGAPTYQIQPMEATIPVFLDAIPRSQISTND